MIHLDQSRHGLAKLLFWLGILIIALGIIFAVHPGLSRMPTGAPAGDLGEKIRTGEAPIPEYTEAIAAKVAASNGFQALASYTDRGFEPATISIHAGETVRFTNNSSGDLWVASSGEKLYPRTHAVCGSSDLDSCAGIKPMDFYEFTFAEAGEWIAINNLDKTKSVRIKVQ